MSYRTSFVLTAAMVRLNPSISQQTVLLLVKKHVIRNIRPLAGLATIFPALKLSRVFFPHVRLSGSSAGRAGTGWGASNPSGSAGTPVNAWSSNPWYALVPSASPFLLNWLIFLFWSRAATSAPPATGQQWASYYAYYASQQQQQQPYSAQGASAAKPAAQSWQQPHQQQQRAPYYQNQPSQSSAQVSSQWAPGATNASAQTSGAWSSVVYSQQAPRAPPKQSAPSYSLPQSKPSYSSTLYANEPASKKQKLAEPYGMPQQPAPSKAPAAAVTAPSEWPDSLKKFVERSFAQYPGAMPPS